MIPLRTLMLFALLVSLSGCASFTSVPITNKAVQGRYTLDEKGGWYAGEYIVLREKDFEYGQFTDVVGDPRMEMFPLRGRYKLDGCLLTLDHRLVESPHRIITPHKGRLIILKPNEADLLLQTGKISLEALYQRPLSRPN
ncbi:hypothetical protein [Prosthecobacter sp.]|uniref:hypothetical protein n=1 Tax=Prosthecobacter sp. TaxID=1965333 RepID=UPI001D55BA0E|nr:hypothetical protein [Prosthecobacter sp.]MCB1276828.1 hypothetical protein [Prosthecobacter sp.]